MGRFLSWYGAGPLHVLALTVSFAVAGYAALHLAGSGRPVLVAVWFVGAAVGHDLVLLPLYALADRSLSAVWQRRPWGPVGGRWVDYVRVPALLSGLLFLVWFPSILRLSPTYQQTSGLSSSGYLARWLLVSATLFAVAAVTLAVRLRRTGPRATAT